MELKPGLLPIRKLGYLEPATPTPLEVLPSFYLELLVVFRQLESWRYSKYIYGAKPGLVPTGKLAVPGAPAIPTLTRKLVVLQFFTNLT